MNASVIVAPEALAQVEAIDDWWRANRPAARGLFSSELDAAFLSLSAAPRVGQAVEHATVKGLRRVLLRTTRFHVYYRVRADVVEVVAVWSCLRGRGPDLSALG